jgi:acetyl esterase/lipase
MNQTTHLMKHFKGLFIVTCYIPFVLTSFGTSIEVWPGMVPGENKSIGPEKDVPNTSPSVLPKQSFNVTRATLTEFNPAKPNGVSIIVCPGGGYRELEMVKEGEEAALWLNSLGITAYVLKYRVPARDGLPRHLPALQDAQRAIRLVRSAAQMKHLDPSKVGIMGFSAGAHLSVMASVNYTNSTYPMVDSIDTISSRPDFAIIVYPGGLINTKTHELMADIHFTHQTPQMFLVDCETDRVDSENCIAPYVALKRLGVPTELHLYTLGVHGFGVRPSKNPHGTWTDRCRDWLFTQNILPQS